MTSSSIGKLAEEQAAEILVAKDFRILSQNWRTRSCEIDIVASKNGCIYFFEVKFRRQNSWSTAAEQLTPAKLSQMRYAALKWIQYCRWPGPCRIGYILIDGPKETLGFLDS